MLPKGCFAKSILGTIFFIVMIPFTRAELQVEEKSAEVLTLNDQTENELTMEPEENWLLPQLSIIGGPSVYLPGVDSIGLRNWPV